MKNKILTIIIIFVLLSVLFINNNIFASETMLENTVSNTPMLLSNNTYISYTLENGTEISVPEFPNGTPYTYLLLYNTPSGWTNALVSYVEGSYFKMYKTVVDSGTTYYCFICCNSAGEQIDYYSYGTDGRYDYWKDSYYFNGHTGMKSSIYEDKYFLTSHNLYNEDGSIFFQVAPVETITLAEIMNKAGEQATLEMGQIILIIIMTTAGLMVLLVGLKKGLTVLMNGFRH